MRSIWKYPLAVTDVQQIKMPYGSDILCVQTQGETACIWARVESANRETARVIRITGTGHQMPSDEALNYIGTFQVHGGALVFHVFEVTP